MALTIRQQIEERVARTEGGAITASIAETLEQVEETWASALFDLTSSIVPQADDENTRLTMMEQTSDAIDDYMAAMFIATRADIAFCQDNRELFECLKKAAELLTKNTHPRR